MSDASTAVGTVTTSYITGLCHGVIEEKRDPHTLPEPLHDLWRDGFHAGTHAAQREIQRLEDAVNHWYVAAHYSPGQIAEMRRKASYLQAQINWKTGVVE